MKENGEKFEMEENEIKEKNLMIENQYKVSRMKEKEEKIIELERK